MQEDEARVHATADLPPLLDGPTVWYGPEMARRQDWVHLLSPQEIAEVEHAARPWAGRELSGLRPAARGEVTVAVTFEVDCSAVGQEGGAGCSASALVVGRLVPA
jgi:hypothetical protein